MMKHNLIVIIFAVLLSACTRTPLPIAAAYPISTQKRMQAAHHWDVLAEHLSRRIRISLQGHTLKPVKSARSAQPRDLLLQLNNVLFDFGMAYLREDALPVIEDLVKFMRENPGRNVRFEGHTDSIGSVEDNQGLSERRAAALRRVLVAQGINPARISTKAYSEHMPLAGNDNPAGRQKNRRVEITVSGGSNAMMSRAGAGPGIGADTLAVTPDNFAAPAQPALYIRQPERKSSFARGFHSLLTTHLVKKGLRITTNKNSAGSYCAAPGAACKPLVLNYSIQVIRHKGREPAPPIPGMYSLTAASLWLIYHIANEWGNPGLAVVPAVVGADAYTLKRHYFPGETDTEVIITTSIADGDLVVAGDTNIYYLNSGDGNF
ncbi:MAG: OmpA family protein [Gammaproteobacteria bacterium]|nr:OmpA family protein [Gammaproteobacteria bacterium]